MSIFTGCLPHRLQVFSPNKPLAVQRQALYLLFVEQSRLSFSDKNTCLSCRFNSWSL